MLFDTLFCDTVPLRERDYKRVGHLWCLIHSFVVLALQIFLTKLNEIPKINVSDPHLIGFLDPHSECGSRSLLSLSGTSQFFKNPSHLWTL
jgi:hypothetical protein